MRKARHAGLSFQTTNCFMRAQPSGVRRPPTKSWRQNSRTVLSAGSGFGDPVRYCAKASEEHTRKVRMRTRRDIRLFQPGVHFYVATKKRLAKMARRRLEED